MKCSYMKMLSSVAIALMLFGWNLVGASEVKTVKIGNQVWMAENLNVKTAEGSWCYDDNPENCEKYGRLYTWTAAMDLPVDCNRKSCEPNYSHYGILPVDCNRKSCEPKYPHQGICPSGFHIPTKNEWITLLTTAGGWHVAGEKLKSRSGWRQDGKGFDSFGFSALPAGLRNYSDNFYDMGDFAYFWSSTEDSSDYAYCMYLFYFSEYAYLDYNYKDNARSVRCLRDSNEGSEASSSRSEALPSSGTLRDSRDGKTYETVKIGNQVWMAENLNVKTEEGSWCYENKSENCTKYGRLYTWAAAMKLPVDCNKDGCKSWVRHQHQGVCPSGFHIPTKEEWKTLVSSVGGRSVAGKVLKSSSGWNNAGDGSDYYGFSALPAGYNSYRNGRFGNAGNYAYFWSASQSMYYRTDYDDYIVKRPDDAYSIYLYYYYDFASIDFNDKLYGFSVRCLRNN